MQLEVACVLQTQSIWNQFVAAPYCTEQSEEFEAVLQMKPKMSSSNDTVYLCNFRVSVDGDWLCLKELHDLQTCEITSSPARSYYFREEYGALFKITNTQLIYFYNNIV